MSYKNEIETQTRGEEISYLTFPNATLNNACSIIFGTCKTDERQLLFFNQPDFFKKENKPKCFELLSEKKIPNIRLLTPETNEFPRMPLMYSSYTDQQMYSILYWAQKSQTDDYYLWKKLEGMGNHLYFISESRQYVHDFSIDAAHRIHWKRHSLRDGLSIYCDSFIATNAESFAFISSKRMPLIAAVLHAFKN